MKQALLIWSIIQSITLTSCSQNADSSLGPGYKWELFKATSNWELAKAVAAQDTDKIHAIIREGRVDVNLQEPRFGSTLLFLAVGNDKEMSTEALLNEGANVNIRDSTGSQAIHESVKFIHLKKNAYAILSSLIKHGADVNALKGKSTVPLEGAIQDLACTKLLLAHGASPYFKSEFGTYQVWFSLFSNNSPDRMNVAKYLIIDQRMPIPNPILYSPGSNKAIDIYSLLEKKFASDSPKMQKTREEIFKYLHEIDFPKTQVYKEKS